MQQQCRPLNVPQKPIAETMTFVRAFDQAGNVSNHKRAKVTEVDDSQVRLERRERIVRDFWLSR